MAASFSMETNSPSSLNGIASQEEDSEDFDSPSDWKHEDGSSGDDFVWENLDLDWMSRPDEDLFMVLPTTAQTEYQTSVYQQSVTLYVRMKSNDTPGIVESSMEVGPWRVPKDKLPVLVGSLAGVCLLFLMGVSLALYVCLYRRHPPKDFSVKSEASSVTSGRSERSAQTLSRDSLVLVTGPNSTHQARLLSDPTGANNFFFDYSFDFYFDPPEGGQRANTLKEGFNVHTYAGRKQNNAESLLQRGFSLRVAKLQKEGSCNLGQRSESGPIITRTDAAKLSDEEDAETEDNDGRETDEVNEEKDDRSVKDGSSEETKADKNSWKEAPPTSIAKQDVLGPSPNQEGEADPSFAYDRNNLIDESLKTRSLPAWVRSKRRPPICNGDFSYSLYGKKDDQPPNKRRRNRMGSDAAQAIAICRSKARLISPGSSLSSVKCFNEPTSKENDASKEASTKSCVEDCDKPLSGESSPKNGDSHAIQISSTDQEFDAVADDLRFPETHIGSICSGDLEYQNLINDAVIIYNERTSL